MIRELRIGNFKAFGPTQTIPIKPLTLIYGPNSGGKSSIIHALALAHEARRRKGDWDVSRTRIGGASIDLGGFKQYVHGHDIDSRSVEWGCTISATDVAEEIQELTKGLSVPVEFQVRGVDAGHLEQLANHLKLLGGGQAQLAIRLTVKAGGRRQAPFLSEYRVDLGDDTVLAVTCPGPNEPLSIERLAEETLFPPDVVQHVRQAPRSFGDNTRKDDRWLPYRLARAEKGVGAGLLNALLGAIDRAVSRALTRLDYLGPLRSFPDRHFFMTDHKGPNWKAGGGWAWAELLGNLECRTRVQEWMKRLGISHRLEAYPHRAFAPNRLVDEIEQALREGGSAASSPTARTDSTEAGIRKKLSEWCATNPSEDLEVFLGTLDESEMRYASALLEDAVEAGKRGELGWRTPKAKQLWDSLNRASLWGSTALGLLDGSGTLLSHRDVGVGTSQVVPVIASAVTSEGRLIAIEQPEIHLHPALQAELGDLFIGSALGERKNTFLIETHSEHLMLRILRRIRENAEGCLPEGLKAPRPEDVSVLYVHRPEGATASEVVEVPIMDDGDFGALWPEGFFPERGKELF